MNKTSTIVTAPKEAVQDAFNRAATTYDEAAAMQWEAGQRLLDRLALIRHEPRRILDIGSSNGRFSQRLREQYPEAKVISLDFAHAMLQNGRSLYPDQVAITADMDQIPLADNSIDLIYSNMTLQWSHDLTTTLSEWYRLLKPGGLLLFTSLGPDTLAELRQAWAQADPEAAHVHVFLDMHEVGDVLQRQGFLDPVMDREFLTLLYTNVRQLMRELRASGTQNQLLERRQTLTGKQRLQKMMRAYPMTEAERYPASYEVIYGHAGKSEPGQQRSRPDNDTISLEAMRAQLRGSLPK